MPNATSFDVLPYVELRLAGHLYQPHDVARTVPKPLNLAKPGNWDVWLTMYPRPTVLRLSCPANAYKPGTGVLLARIVDEKGQAVPNALVDVEARQAIVIGDTLYQPRRSYPAEAI